MIDSATCGHYEEVEPRRHLASRRTPPASHDDARAAVLRGGSDDQREAAWRSLYDQEFDRVYRLVCRLGAEPAEVEDLVQRAFLIAFQRLDEVEVIHSPVGWLRGIAVRVVAQHRRWRGVREAKRWLLRDLRVSAPPPVIAPDAAANASREIDRCRVVLGRLNPKLRDVLVLCDVEECTPKEVAGILDIPVNTVRSRRRLARDKFTAIWHQEYGAR